MSIKEQLKKPGQPGSGKKITGADLMALERFAEDTRHMIVFDVLEWECPVGGKGERIRIFLSDDGYEKAKGLLSQMLSLPGNWDYAPD